MVSARTLHRMGRALFVDARERSACERARIQGAMCYGGLDDAVALLAHKEGVATVIVYCDAGCARADAVAFRISQKTSLPVHIFRAGWQEWARMDLPTSKGAAP